MGLSHRPPVGPAAAAGRPIHQHPLPEPVANPFSLSVTPNGHTLRITAKALGDGVRGRRARHPGAVRGPVRTAQQPGAHPTKGAARRRRRRHHSAAGARGGLDYAPGEAIILQRYTAEPPFSRELDVLAAHKGLHVLHLPGPRRSPTSVLGPATHDMPELIALRRWIPDIADRDVFLCGPSTWADGMEWLVLAGGVTGERIHTESFGW